MKYPRKSARAVALNLKPVAAGAFVFALFGSSLGLVLYSKNHPAAMEDMRMAIANTAAPVVQALAKPADAVRDAGAWVRDMFTLHEENQRLKAENDRLLRWQSVAMELATENDHLKSMAHFPAEPHPSYITARVASDGVNTYSHSIIISTGSQQGVVGDSAVVNEHGLVGRITEVGKKTSRVLLLTDINSRIPVVAQSSREHAIASGNGSDGLSLMYLPENSKIKQGELVVTSGDGGVLPYGLPVGVITKAEKGSATLQTFADWNRLEFVSVVDTPR